MPYFIFDISPGPSQIVSSYTLLDQRDDFKQAKKLVREKRAELPSDATNTIRMIFAKDLIEAEELLSAKREAPILQEWEK